VLLEPSYQVISDACVESPFSATNDIDVPHYGFFVVAGTTFGAVFVLSLGTECVITVSILTTIAVSLRVVVIFKVSSRTTIVESYLATVVVSAFTTLLTTARVAPKAATEHSAMANSIFFMKYLLG
jgi:hypothetical protein